MAGGDPLGAVERLALGTVAVPAGVVGDAGERALAALFDVAAEGRGATEFDGAQGAKMLARQGMTLSVGGPEAGEDAGQFETGAGHNGATSSSVACRGGYPEGW